MSEGYNNCPLKDIQNDKEKKSGIKCGHDGKTMKLCTSMEMYYENNGTRKGIHFLDNAMDLGTGVVWNLGPYYRSGSKDSGVVFNFCPWCGSDLEKNWREPVNVNKDLDIEKANKKKSK